MPNAHPLIKQLVEIRKSKNLSQDRLAADLDCDRAQIVRWEKGQIKPNVYTFCDWCTALGVTITLTTE